MYKGWSKIPFFSHVKKKYPDDRLRISVIIAVRNEQDNIGRTLDCIIAQDCPSHLYEVIVVDDHSTDNTAAIVRSYSKRGVSLIQLNEKEPINSYKKLAIAKAIDQSRGNIIITTDGDCRMGKNWLSAVISSFDENNCYMLSSPVFYSEERSLFEKVQTLEFSFLIGLGAAGIGNQQPNTCNGANLAYRKDVFYEMGGFKGIDDLASGDDELLLHKIAEKHSDKIFFCKSLDAVVYTDAKPTLRAFINQRKRWASKSTKYKDKKVVFLGVSIWLFNLSFILALLLLPFYLSTLFPVLLFCITVKFVIEFLFILPLLKFSCRLNYIIYLPFLSIIHPFYLVYIGIAGNIGKYDWKGRVVK